MLVLHHRLAIAGVITAIAIAVPAAAFAAGSGSPSGKPTPPQASASATKSAAAGQSQLTALAASAGISVSQLQAGLEAAKQAGGNTAAGIAAFAASTGVPQATAQRVVYAVFGTQVSKQPGPTTAPPQPVNALAAQLGVSRAAAQRAFNQLDALGRDANVPASPAFAAVAHELGLSPARLAAALVAAKQSMAGR
jgi:hypothetical protein